MCFLLSLEYINTMQTGKRNNERKIYRKYIVVMFMYAEL